MGMMLEQQEYEFLRERIEHVLVFGQPTAWQRRFLEDMLAKLVRFGSRTRLSDKQLSTLRRITQATRVVRMPASGGTYQRPGWMAREARWFVRHFLRDFAAFAAVMAFIGGLLIISQGFPWTSWSTEAVATTRTGTTTKAQGTHRSFSVIDGDTLRLSDGSRMRLVGFNTPESGDRAACEREAELSARASARLQQLVTASRTGVTQVACACPPGTEGTSKCNHGRSCGRLTVDGRDAGQILVAEGLAVPFTCSGERCPPTPRPWCN
ncbi:Thermonuclease family protein (plasmid) [Shinella sp. WSC3-e]|nr:Thermonuclease family protein [Shinella sp. WSC3-e]